MLREKYFCTDKIFYLVYWIPNIDNNFDIFNPCCKSFCAEFNEEKDEKVKLCIYLVNCEEENRDCFLIKEENSDESLAKLVPEDHDKNGLVLFRVEILSENKLNYCSFWVNSFYHKFKELYHTHKFHSYDEDAILEGLVLDEKKDWKGKILEKLINDFSKKINIFEEELFSEIHLSKLENYTLDLESLRFHCNNMLMNFVRLQGELFFLENLLKTLGKEESFNLLKRKLNLLEIKLNECDNFLKIFISEILLEILKELRKIKSFT